MSADGTGQTNHEKGQRNEREACDILKRVYGSGVEKVDAFTNHDPFGLVDIIAMQPGERVKFVQVKTNTITGKDLQKYKTRAWKLPLDHAEFEVWVRVDREGWKLLEYDGEDFDQYGTLPCNTSDAREQYHSLHTEARA